MYQIINKVSFTSFYLLIEITPNCFIFVHIAAFIVPNYHMITIIICILCVPTDKYYNKIFIFELQYCY